MFTRFKLWWLLRRIRTSDDKATKEVAQISHYTDTALATLLIDTARCTNALVRDSITIYSDGMNSGRSRRAIYADILHANNRCSQDILACYGAYLDARRIAVHRGLPQPTPPSGGSNVQKHRTIEGTSMEE